MKKTRNPKTDVHKQKAVILNTWLDDHDRPTLGHSQALHVIASRHGGNWHLLSARPATPLLLPSSRLEHLTNELRRYGLTVSQSDVQELDARFVAAEAVIADQQARAAEFEVISAGTDYALLLAGGASITLMPETESKPLRNHGPETIFADDGMGTIQGWASLIIEDEAVGREQVGRFLRDGYNVRLRADEFQGEVRSSLMFQCLRHMNDADQMFTGTFWQQLTMLVSVAPLSEWNALSQFTNALVEITGQNPARCMEFGESVTDPPLMALTVAAQRAGVHVFVKKLGGNGNHRQRTGGVGRGRMSLLPDIDAQDIHLPHWEGTAWRPVIRRAALIQG